MQKQPGKNIVACSDGTGNSAVKGRGSNVFKLYEAIALNDGNSPEQIAIYDDGIGTQKFRLLRVATGVAGYGMKRNVRQLYIEISRAYKPGDQIYLFGFSRGAFTVRMLAGLIATQGLIDCEKASPARLGSLARGAQNRLLRDHLKQALFQKLLGNVLSFMVSPWRYDYDHSDFVHSDNEQPTESAAIRSPETGVGITFIGAWDTVNAVGFPIAGLGWIWNKLVYKFTFPDEVLHKRVVAASHALSLDDQRGTFHPTTWDESGCTQNNDQRINQVWFAGVHSNVGGGYPKQGLSMITLDWMMSEAELAQPVNAIRFEKQQRSLIRSRANIDDKLYDSRAGLAKFYRYAPRELSNICSSSKIPVRIHHSVLYRAKESRSDGYTPLNIPQHFEIVGRTTRPSSRIPIGTVTLQGPASVTGIASKRYFLDKVRQAAQIGFFAINLPVLFWCISIFETTSWEPAWYEKSLLCFASPFDCFARPVAGMWNLLIPLVGLNATLYAAAIYAEKKTKNHLQEFWHTTEIELLD